MRPQEGLTQTATRGHGRPVAADACPLCGSGVSPFHSVRNRAMTRDFVHCAVCDLVSVSARFHVGHEAERRRYLEHDNNPDDADYRAFLDRLWSQMKPQLDPGSKGLDYGAGPGPALAAMMAEDGFVVSVYDKHFHPDRAVLQDTYDFIVCTETAEHFDDPARDFRALDGLLRPGGWLGVMTAMLDDWADFPEWYYHRDPTHIAFYSRRTMGWIADAHGWRPSFPKENVVLLHKS